MSATLALYKRRGYGLALVILAMGLFGGLYTRLPDAPAAPASESTAYTWPDTPKVNAGYFSAIAPVTPINAPVNTASSHLRLSGTFMTYDQVDDEGQEPVGTIKAMLDDVKARKTKVVGVGDRFSDCLVKRIEANSVLLERDGEEFTLQVASGPVGLVATTSRPGETEEAPLTFEDMPAISTSRFGKKIGDNRWVIRRAALMDYWDDVRNDAERLAMLFSSFTTNRDPATEEPLGFNVNPAGEADFWAAMGLQDGDVMKKVNSMNMTTQRRGEFMLNEFFQHNLNAVVIDVERNGNPEKLIYLIR
ncbi:MAG: hypothetical protein ACI9TH_001915 [Kiritimatiellia bacterium]|jgi:hypothetical protein